jgi:hypothetical protein
MDFILATKPKKAILFLPVYKAGIHPITFLNLIFETLSTW